MGIINNIKKSFLEPKLEQGHIGLNPIEEDQNRLVNNKFDYSNSVPTVSAIKHLVKYLYNTYEQYLWLITEDERSYEETHKYYNYEKSHRLIFDVRIREKNYNIITCKTEEEFEKCIQKGDLNNIDSMEIRLIIDYKQQDTTDYIIYNNTFTVLIKPFDIVFLRKSNSNQIEMASTENNINEILKRFPKINSIFCTK